MTELQCLLLILSWSLKVKSEVAQSCPTLCDPVDCDLLGFSVHGILEARILEWIAISFPRGSSQPRDQTQVSRIGGRRFNLWATRETSIRVFSNESTLHMRWPKYWSFSFSISPSKEHPGLISLEWTGWIFLQSKGLSRVFSNTTVQKHHFFGTQLSSQSNSHIHTWPLEKP